MLQSQRLSQLTPARRQGTTLCHLERHVVGSTRFRTPRAAFQSSSSKNIHPSVITLGASTFFTSPLPFLLPLSFLNFSFTFAISISKTPCFFSPNICNTCRNPFSAWWKREKSRRYRTKPKCEVKEILMLRFQALLQARLETRYQLIEDTTLGPIFLGTPHRSSDKAPYGKVLVNVAHFMTHRPPKFNFVPPISIFSVSYCPLVEIGGPEPDSFSTPRTIQTRPSRD